MRRTLKFLAVGMVLALVGCGDNTPVGLDGPLFKKDRAGSPELSVVTYNVYVGAGLEFLLGVEDPMQIPIAAATVWAQVQATNFIERAEAIADQIAVADAHVVGLQEVSLFRRHEDWGTDFLLDFPLPAPNADEVELDYLQLLLDALADRGLDYVVAAASTNLDIELPMCLVADPVVCLQTWNVGDIRLTDYDVILVREGVDWGNAAAGTYAAVFPLTINIPEIPDPVTICNKPSGWASVDVTLKGLQYRVVSTHLEPADILPGGEVHPGLALIQAGQLLELFGMVDLSPHPVIMMGDFNSAAAGTTTDTYGDVLDAGFVDTWLIGRWRGDGYTSNQAADLMNPDSELYHRIDFVFYRDAVTALGGPFRGSVSAELLGDEQADRTASGMWPSDHAGLAVTLRMAPAMN